METLVLPAPQDITKILTANVLLVVLVLIQKLVLKTLVLIVTVENGLLPLPLNAKV